MLIRRDFFKSKTVVKMNNPNEVDYYYGEGCKKILKKYLETNKNSCDVSLIGSDEVTIKSHTIILSACSVYFDNVLKKFANDKKNLVILLPSYNSKEIQAILDFIYYGTMLQIDQVCVYLCYQH